MATFGCGIGKDSPRMPPELTYCIVNTNGREHVPACLGAIAETHPEGVEHEILLLDNASDDGSVALAEELAAGDPRIGSALRVIALERREGKAANDTRLLQEAAGEYCLLLNEDSELQPGAAAALLDAMRADPKAGAAGAQLLDPAGVPQPCAWRLPGVGTALAQALFLHKWLVTESGGDSGDPPRVVGWAQSAALLVRRSAAERIGYLDPAFFVYSDETDFQAVARSSRAPHALRSRRPGGPPRAALDRPDTATNSPGWGVVPRSRPLASHYAWRYFHVFGGKGAMRPADTRS